MTKHIDIVITGKVQGVFFRAATKAVADQLGVKGYVKNEKDGTVFVAAEADSALLDMFLEWCNEGPEKAEVKEVKSSGGELKNYRNFEVMKKNLLW
ncbi:MAG: acylphosphatase [Sphingobacteriaceae bacterium]|nr:MAG: acylphosphatase [Sphingobacteriaceae bacterium]